MAAGDGAPLPGTMVPASRNVEKALEEAAASGALHLANRKLKEFPRSAKNYDLSDITHADLSRNRLCELPEELCHFISLETLSLYHNGMRSLSSGICNLQALTYLNISRNLLCSLPPSVFELPLLRVLIVSNNKLCSLPSSIYSLTHLRQLDLSCNELQSLPVELSQLECLRDLNLRRNRLTALPEEMSELPLVRLDVSCNRISRVPLCFRHLRSLQILSLDNNPLQMPPAHVCSRGKYHIFKYLNMEACRGSSGQELERQLRPSGFTSCLSEQELFPSPLGGLDSGFNSVDSGSKRWSGNESAEDFSERSREREQRSLEEEQEEEEEEQQEEEQQDTSPRTSKKFLPVNGQVEHLDFGSSLAKGEEEGDLNSAFCPLSAPYLAGEQVSSPPARQSQSPAELSPQPQVKTPPSPSSPSSPTLEGRRRPETLLIWQERERLQQQQRDKAMLSKSTTKAASPSATTPRTEISSPAADVDLQLGSLSLAGSCSSANQMSLTCPPVSPHHGSSRADKTSPSAGKVQKPNSFLFRTSSQSGSRPTGSSWTLGQSGRSESRTTLRSPKEERADVGQLRKTLESRLKVPLPEDLGEALSNGTVLCQLVNQIRPRSVSIIHIPSPAVPRLSSAKCRLNVENFLAACRKLGLPETDVCVCSDVLLCRLPALSRCVAALLALRGGREELEEQQQQQQEEEEREPEQQQSSALSLLSTDFLLFYCAAMALLYVLYCHVLT